VEGRPRKGRKVAYRRWRGRIDVLQGGKQQLVAEFYFLNERLDRCGISAANVGRYRARDGGNFRPRATEPWRVAAKAEHLEADYLQNLLRRRDRGQRELCAWPHNGQVFVGLVEAFPSGVERCNGRCDFPRELQSAIVEFVHKLDMVPKDVAALSMMRVGKTLLSGGESRLR
jgi:hypothetical protein